MGYLFWGILFVLSFNLFSAEEFTPFQQNDSLWYKLIKEVRIANLIHHSAGSNVMPVTAWPYAVTFKQYATAADWNEQAVRGSIRCFYISFLNSDAVHAAIAWGFSKELADKFKQDIDSTIESEYKAVYTSRLKHFYQEAAGMLAFWEIRKIQILTELQKLQNHNKASDNDES